MTSAEAVDGLHLHVEIAGEYGSKFYHYYIINMKYLLILSLAALTLAIMPREEAPGFEAVAVMPNHSFKQISLADYEGKYVVLLFYPFDFTYVCPTEITSYSDRIAEFRSIGAEVLAISVDSQFSHLAWRKTSRENGGLGQVDIPLVADITKSICLDYGVLVENENDPLNGASLRGLFIIDGKGKVRSITINDEQVGRNAEETLRTIKAFQHAEKHGVVCPAGWNPGSKTIVPDQDKSKDYFREL